MDKLYRRTQILDLLGAEPAATQADLRRKLERRGIRVTQATVSRDIEELGVVKTRGGYRLPESAEAAAPQPGGRCQGAPGSARNEPPRISQRGSPARRGHREVP